MPFSTQSQKGGMAGKTHLPSFERIANHIEGVSGFCAAVLSLCFLVSTLFVAARRPLWLDEIYTVLIARTPTVGDMLAIFKGDLDQTPPLNAFLVRLFGSIFGWSELVVRLPSAMFAITGLLILFRRIQTLTSGLSGLAAMSLLLVTSLPAWAHEARPYAMLFFASALAIYFWTSPVATSSRAHEKRVSLFFGIALMLAAFAHYYGVLLILPFAAVQARQGNVRNLFSFRLLCGMVGLSLGIALQLPFVRAASSIRLMLVMPFWGTPSLTRLQGSYLELLMPSLFALICAVLLYSSANARNRELIERQGSEEALGWFFLALPVTGYLLAVFVTHLFHPRYFIPILAGFGLALGCFIYRFCRTCPSLALFILITAVPLFIKDALFDIRYAQTPGISHRSDESDFAVRVLPQIRREGKKFVLLSSVHTYVEARYYARDSDMLGLFMAPSSYGAQTSKLLHLQFFSKDDLVQHGREAAIIAPSAQVLSEVEKLGFHVHWRITNPLSLVYLE